MAMRDELPDENIKHVVVLMLENRGFDHIMGWLYSEDVEAPADYKVVGRDGDYRRFQGLSSMDDAELAQLANPLPKRLSTTGETLPINKGARSPRTPSYNTGESFAHIFNQMWGVGFEADVWKHPDTRAVALQQLQAKGPAPMTGYVLDYDLDVQHHVNKQLDRTDLGEVLDIYLPEQMPVLSGLARAYAVSDEWFCSVPSQTNTNRAFSFTGTSRGMVDNSFYDPPSWNPVLAASLAGLSKLKGHEVLSNSDALPVSTRSLFEVLQSEGLSWKLYWQSEWPPRLSTGLVVQWQYTRTMIPLLLDSQFNGNFEKFDAGKPLNGFFQAARSGNLPAVSWIEPKWGGGEAWDSKLRGVGNDYHPVSDTTVGEDFVMDVYNALSASPKWKNTLLVITFDENGGTYDHVVPPPATPPGNESCPLPHAPIDRGDLHAVVEDPTTRTQYGFDFAQYGVRVPTILVSPQTPPRTIFRSPTTTPFDHASIIATILKLAQVDPARWQLGERVANAPTFEALVRRGPDQPLNMPAAPFSLPDGRDGATGAASYNQPYLLEYVGSLWPDSAKTTPVYLSASKAGSWVGGYQYPTLRQKTDAVPFYFAPTNSGDEGALISNMSVLKIATTERGRAGQVLTAAQSLAAVYFSNETGAGAQWQIRILSSRHRGDTVQVGDYIYFVSQLKTLGQDPLQRLLPYPPDPLYTTTRAGEWALWRIVRAPETV